MPKLVFVDDKNRVVGAGAWQEALEKDFKLRVSRIYIFNDKGELFVQRRSVHVRFSPGLWDQSVSGHVDEGETYLQAAHRELQEELGVVGLKLKRVGKYYSEDEMSGIIRKRFSTIYTAHYDGDFNLNAEEVSEGRWISLPDLEIWMAKSPNEFSNPFLNSYKYFKSHFLVLDLEIG